MGNDLIFKIAVGVFLGLAAWANREHLGTVALYAVFFFIFAYILITCYNAIANPIKEFIKVKAVRQLVRELHEHSLVESQHEGALTLGLQKEFAVVDFNLLQNLFNDYKGDLRSGNSGSYYKSQIAKIISETVDDFKMNGSQI